MITFTDLRQMLGLSQPQLTKLVSDGLPHVIEKGKKLFDEADVARWLVAQGYAEEEPTAPPAASVSASAGSTICTTKGEAATALGVSTRTLGDWLKHPDFPGRSGGPGRQDGYFPIEAIQAWHEAKFGKAAGTGNSARDRVHEARAKHLELDYERELQNLVSVEQIESLMIRTFAAFKAILEGLPDEVVALLPAKTDDKTRSRVRRKLDDKVDHLLTTLAELVEGDRDENEDEQEA